MALLAYDFRTVTAVTSLNLLDHHKFTMVMKDIGLHYLMYYTAC